MENEYFGGIVTNEDELSASLPMKFKAEGGQVFKILSNLYRIKTHYTDPKIINLAGKTPTSIAYMGENSLAIQRGLKVKEDLYYLVEVNGERVVQLLPAGFVYAINDVIKELKKVKKNAGVDKRMYSWELIKIEAQTRDEFTQYSAKIKEEVTPVTPAELEMNTKMLVDTMAGYADRLRQKYSEYMSSSTPAPAPKEEVIDDEPVDDRAMNERINIDDIPF